MFSGVVIEGRFGVTLAFPLGPVVIQGMSSLEVVPVMCWLSPLGRLPQTPTRAGLVRPLEPDEARGLRDPLLIPRTGKTGL